MKKSILDKEINALYKTNDKMKNFNGYIYISENNNELFSQSFGMANYSTMTPSDCDTIFRTGSVSKQFTAMCILILEKQGLLSIDDYLKKYFPDYINGFNITIRQLLNMTSGISEYLNHPDWKEHEIPENKALGLDFFYEFIKNVNLEYTAGLKMKYSNPNYVLLAIIIEKVSGISYRNFLQKNIFSVLNMTRSGYPPISVHFENIAVGYNSLKPTPQEADSIIYNTGMGANNIYTTVSDLRKWDSALYTDTLISYEKVNEMFNPSSVGEYGFGWFINKDEVNHGGGAIGFNTMISRNLKTKRLIIMLCNVTGCEEVHIGHYYDLLMKLME